MELKSVSGQPFLAGYLNLTRIKNRWLILATFFYLCIFIKNK